MNTTNLLLRIPLIGRRIIHAKASLYERTGRCPIRHLDAQHIDASLVRQARRLFTLFMDKRDANADTHDGMMQVAERLALTRYGSTLAADTDAVELGSFTGVGTCFLAAGVASRSSGGRVWAVDSFAGSTTIDFEITRYQASLRRLGGTTLTRFRRNMRLAGCDRHVTPIVSDTTAAARDWTGRPIGLLLVDANHTYESCRDDFLAWRPHLAPGATVMFHDYSSGFPGVIEAVDELLATQPLTVVDTVHMLKVCRWSGQAAKLAA